MTEAEAIFDRQHISLRELQSLTAQGASYGASPDPEGVLRSGLVEEVAEYWDEVVTNPNTAKDDLEGELGDVLWYISEISRFREESIVGLMPQQTLEDFQTSLPSSLLMPVVDTEGNTFDLSDSPAAVLAVTALRVVDSMNPKNPKLWLPGEHQLSLGEALGDLLTATAYIANLNDVALSEAVRHTHNKLSSRMRSPHVIEREVGVRPVNSLRHRLNIHPFIEQVLRESLVEETHL